MVAKVQWTGKPDQHHIHGQAEVKQLHSYRGYTALRNAEYWNHFGPVLDGNGRPVDGLTGMWTDIRMLEREIDKYLDQQFLQEKLRRDKLMRETASQQPDEPGAIDQVGDSQRYLEPSDSEKPSDLAVQWAREDLIEEGKQRSKSKTDGGH